MSDADNMRVVCGLVSGSSSTADFVAILTAGGGRSAGEKPGGLPPLPGGFLNMASS